MRNALSSDERPAGPTISDGVIVSELKRSEEGVPGRFVCEELAKRDADPVRTCRGAGRRDEGRGAYGVPTACDDDREFESKYGASIEVLTDVLTVGASLSRDVLYELAMGGVYGRGVCRMGCTYCAPKRGLLDVVVDESCEVALVVRLWYPPLRADPESGAPLFSDDV